MTPDIVFTAHLPEGLLEEYAFNRLGEEKLARVEEHLLVCPACQDKLREVDEYIRLMKRAARNVQRPSPRWGKKLWWPAAAAVASMAAVALTVPWARPPETSRIELVSFRGAEMARANAGRLLELKIDVAELAAQNRFRVQVVSSQGREEWSGTGEARDAGLIVHLPQTLSRGVHWVRVASLSGELLREYGVRVE